MPSQRLFKIFILGPQGAGKGTQAELVGQALHLPVLSAGQLLRDEVRAKTLLGLEIEETLRGGHLVPDAVSATVLRARLQQPDVLHGYVLDGFPRNLSQYQTFTFDLPTHVVVLDISEEESIRRLTGRLTCDTCGKVVSMHDGYTVGQACMCGGTLVQRDDDTPEAIGRRLGIYQTETRQVIDAYAAQGLVHHVDGMGTVTEVFARIQDALQLSSYGTS